MATADVTRSSGEPAAPADDTFRWSGIAVNTAAWAFAFVVLRIFAVSGSSRDTSFLVSTTLGLNDAPTLVFGFLMARPG